MITYRKYHRNDVKRHYEYVFCTLIHQCVDMIRWCIDNIQKYNPDLNYAIVIHFNSNCDIDENDLPHNVFLSMKTINTERNNSRLIHGMVQNFKTVKERVTCDYICTLSSGSGFFRKFNHNKPNLTITSFSSDLDNTRNYEWNNSFPIEQLGNITSKLSSLNVDNLWHFPSIDKDKHFKTHLLKRNFKYIKNGQMSGNIINTEIASMLIDDLDCLLEKIIIEYPLEEIYISTYAYNWCIMNNFKMDRSFVMINWVRQPKPNFKQLEYNITNSDFISKYDKYPCSAICKLPEDLNHTVRKMLRF